MDSPLIPDSAVVVGVVFAGLVALLALDRLREKRVRALLVALGRSAVATVTEYSEGEEGCLVTYRFVPEGHPVEVERTEALPRRPTRRPQPGSSIPVRYLKALPSVSRANLESF